MTRTIVFLLLLAATAGAQPAGLRGVVKDPSGAVVPGAVVQVRSQSGRELRQTTNESGAYQFSGLELGTYSIQVTKPGFAAYEAKAIEVRGPVSFDIELSLETQAQSVTVSDQAAGVATEPSQNAGAIVLNEEDLKSFSDDPDELEEQLRALAGPGAGPGGGQIYIDGFTGGRLPPKSAIREVRINQNPYSAEYDHIGFGRIEILTKPGTDRFRGEAFLGFSDESLNSRNPFAPNKAPYQARLFGTRISGPLGKRASFSLDADARSIEENAVINARILDANLQPVPYQQAVVAPFLRWDISPRLDYQLNDKNTLVIRYQHSPARSDNRGVGDQSLLSRAFNTRESEHSLQITETAVLSTRAVNETRFQVERSSLRQLGDNSVPALNVLDAFYGGGAQVGLTDQKQLRLEWQNLTTLISGAHTFKFGGRLRVSNLKDLSPNNFGGTFVFAGGVAPLLDDNNQPVFGADGFPLTTQITSLERYRRTLLFQGLGFTAAQIRALGGGASQFTINGGNPRASVSQLDAGLFAAWDWRARPNLTFSAGLRWEDQTNISNHNNFAPRLGLAWALDGGPGRPAKTVLRWGAGVFYDRVADDLTLSAIRFNGINQVNYVVRDPDFFPNVPALGDLVAYRSIQTIWKPAADLRTPYLLQTSIGIERQLPHNTVVATNYIFSRGVHLLRARNINAPLPDGQRPYGDLGNLNLYESTGFSRQSQLVTNFNTRFSRRLSLFGFYAYNRAFSDTDGTTSFPANPYDLHSEWGPSRLDVRHRFVLGGSIQMKWGLSLNPFVHAASGAPFNIITGRDTNGDTIFNDRPAFATDPNAPGVVRTAWGNFLLQPGPGDVIIPRNYGRGPAQFALNLRLGKTWGFGEASGGEFRGDRGPHLMGPPPPGGMRGEGPMRGGPRGSFFGESTGRKYNLTLSVSVMNLLNHVNLGAPNGNLSSPLFGQSTQLAAGFGPRGGSAAGNRRIELQLRFSF